MFFRKFNLSKLSRYTIYQLSVETATIHQLSFQEKPSLVHFTVLTYLLVLRISFLPAIVHKPVFVNKGWQYICICAFMVVT